MDKDCPAAPIQISLNSSKDREFEFGCSCSRRKRLQSRNGRVESMTRFQYRRCRKHRGLLCNGGVGASYCRYDGTPECHSRSESRIVVNVSRVNLLPPSRGPMYKLWRIALVSCVSDEASSRHPAGVWGPGLSIWVQFSFEIRFYTISRYKYLFRRQLWFAWHIFETSNHRRLPNSVCNVLIKYVQGPP